MNLPKPEIDRATAIELWVSERSEYAKEQVVLNNLGIVGIALKSLNLNPLDEDLFATGIVGLVNAVNTFNPEKGFKFSTYAAQVIRNEILMTFRKKRIIPVFSLDEQCDLGNGEGASYADIIADGRRFEEEVIADMQFGQMVDCLGEREKKIILLRMDDKTQCEVAEICKISQAHVSRIVKSACEKCKKKFC